MKRPSCQDGRVGLPLTDLIPPLFCACTKPGSRFPTLKKMWLFLFTVS